MEIDYEYLCQNLGHLSGLQTRVYQRDQLIYQYVNCDFQPDLVNTVWSRIAESPNRISFFAAADSLYFGALKKKDQHITLVIGPTYRLNVGNDRKVAILRLLGESQSRLNELDHYLQSIPAYPLENFLQILLFINYSINNEKMTLSELIARDSGFQIPIGLQSKMPAQPAGQDSTLHNTYDMEQQVFSYVRAGQTDALREFVRQPPTGRAGKMANDDLRQLKNTFICAATLASRAAIEGGLSPESALSLSDLYIQKAEMLNHPLELSKLNVDMVFDYAYRVEALKCRGSKTKLTTDVLRYINAHLDQQVTTERLASALRMNRTHLCERFRQDTGITVAEFVTEIKLEEAKRLLRTTEKPIAQISELLGFSSQSYFQNVFRKKIGTTPDKYRKAGGT